MSRRQGPAGQFRVESPFGNSYGSYGAYGANNQSAEPKTARCVFCDKEKPADAFSKSQWSKVTWNPYAPPGYNRKPKAITCKQCTAKQSDMLQCMICTLKKPKEQFAKNQRRNAERARCLKCMKKREEEDVHDSEPDDSSDDDYGNETWYDYT
ncbi:hypothetical protein VTP01DRAFT_2432 [Rhizomucor pusillus]|uniref:uncharacterized protein n=1 Tax=Rhizomucor pusillus TaxID=4840 RepID=UPI0037445388